MKLSQTSTLPDRNWYYWLIPLKSCVILKSSNYWGFFFKQRQDNYIQKVWYTINNHHLTFSKCNILQYLLIFSRSHRVALSKGTLKYKNVFKSVSYLFFIQSWVTARIGFKTFTYLRACIGFFHAYFKYILMCFDVASYRSLQTGSTASNLLRLLNNKVQSCYDLHLTVLIFSRDNNAYVLKQYDFMNCRSR